MDYKITIKQMVADGVIPQEVVERYFPELKENEDERIRKMLIEFFGKGAECNGSTNGISDKDILAWLEKQGESDETKAKVFLINKGYPIDANGVFPTYEEMYNIIREGLEQQDEQILANSAKTCKDEQKSWSEVDNFMYNKIKNLLTDISLAPESINSLFDWLKDLKDRVQPQNRWKPSDEQIDALDFAADCIVPAEFCVKRKVLKELLEQLKKLREE